MTNLFLLARNEELNQWLSENPLVLGGIFLALGLLVGGFGVRDLVTGQATGKWGMQMTGPMARLYGAVRLIAGIGCAGFGAYHLARGIL